MALVQYLYYLPRTLGNTVKPLLKDCHIKKCSTYILHIDRSYILRHPSTLRTPPSMSTRRGKNIPWNNPHCHSRYRSFREKLVRLDRSFISIRLSQDFEDLKLLQELVHVYPTSWPSLLPMANFLSWPSTKIDVHREGVFSFYKNTVVRACNSFLFQILACI